MTEKTNYEKAQEQLAFLEDWNDVMDEPETAERQRYTDICATLAVADELRKINKNLDFLTGFLIGKLHESPSETEDSDVSSI